MPGDREPRTEAGNRLANRDDFDWRHDMDCDKFANPPRPCSCGLLDAILAIEAEAASDSTTRGDLDADRLRRAIDNVNEMDPLDYLDEGDNVDAIAAEYARLSSEDPGD